LRDNALSH